MSKPSPTFRDIQSSFEARGKPTTATNTTSPTAYRSAAGDLANMSNDKSSTNHNVSVIAQSIDSVLDTPAAKQQPQRPLAKLRPSWIGPPRPERPVTRGVSPVMKQHVTIEYSSPGLKPPVYICTSLSDPQWDAVEMQAEKKDGAEYRFFKAFDVEEGEYQYKFRLGPGDWWVCDEKRMVVDDGAGNRNNLLVVKAQDVKKELPALSLEKVDSKATIPPAVVVPGSHPGPHAIMSPAPSEASAPTPLMKHEAFVASQGSESQQAAELEIDDPPEDEKSLDDLEPPTMRHETLAFDKGVFVQNRGSESQQTPEHEINNSMEAELSPDDVESPMMRHETLTSNDEDNQSELTDEEDSSSTSSDEEDNDEMSNSPLLRHESISLHSHEQEHAPLFRHESIALGYNHHEHPATTISPTKHSSPHHVPMEADPNDPSLEKFPTDHAGILEKIRRTSTSLPEDETSDHGSPTSQAMSDTSHSSHSLPSVREDDEEALERIREAEEEEYEKEEESGEEMDPLRLAEPEDADFEPKIKADDESIVIEQRIVFEVVERRRSSVAEVMEKMGGGKGVMAFAIGIVVAGLGVYVARFF